jgi:hypothetical protein
MPRGGARPGAGAKKGRRKTAQLGERALEVLTDAGAAYLPKDEPDPFAGMLPLDVMLSMMRSLARVSTELMERGEAARKEGTISRQDALDVQTAALRYAMLSHKCAVDAAPYMHPRRPPAVPPDDPETPANLPAGTDPVGIELAAEMRNWTIRT